ncbi:hypothetical protein M436DRAFT_46915 [Aureobasidium namibiae CBS 147.97]|uniref:DUF7918 domain-containing protein n=1 Tax=Aureobasidium namibiae CBS 147.97 TaxID=1043004 RepID=A0A074WUM0_9PEZI|nr:uncharacterized protein M436DRAFT_46915 [Aureobasidium namibiae CBS 147.97]KEQ73432.1 hypothetical protein M436DRAFT_46915 [Aureobasidium namibiae CBS 147.97]
MAIIPGIPHVIVDIAVDGNPLPEYLDEDDSESITPNSTTKYVECMPGSHFAIRINLTNLQHWHLRGGDSVETSYFLDGQRVGGVMLPQPWLSGYAVYSYPAARYMEGGICKERALMFADLVTSEDRAYAKPRPELNHLGTITVKLYHSKAGKTDFRDSDNASEANVGHENIHEKHLKGQAISTQAKLGEAKPIGRIMTTASTRIGDAFATFNFRYRSRKDLQISCLIPRSPSPIPLEDRPEESLTRDELLELCRRQKARQEEMVVIKLEHEKQRTEEKRTRVEDESDEEPTLTYHHPPTKKLKISADAHAGIETVDLTDD